MKPKCMSINNHVNFLSVYFRPQICTSSKYTPMAVQLSVINVDPYCMALFIKDLSVKVSDYINISVCNTYSSTHIVKYTPLHYVKYTPLHLCEIYTCTYGKKK